LARARELRRQFAEGIQAREHKGVIVMRILITGATGFIGGHLIGRLVCEHHVYSLERYMTGRYVLGGHRDVRSVFCDLRDHFAVRQAVRDVQPEVVIHLAAISPVAYSYDHPNEVMDANLQGTIHLAEACLREVPHFKQFLFASTSETYGNGPVPKDEDTPYCGPLTLTAGKTIRILSSSASSCRCCAGNACAWARPRRCAIFSTWTITSVRISRVWAIRML
jgi:NAD(P)-dependent dehydrogenase (short-subunit alcohol dehydrogenase family)